jgi:ATP-dependent DNA helicase RecG
LEQYDGLKLSSEEKAVILMGRRGDLISPNDIIRRLGIVDTEHYRQVVSSLQTKGVLSTALTKLAAKAASKRKGVAVRDVARFKVKNVKDISSDRIGRSHAPVTRDALEDVDEKRALYVGNIPPNTSERDVVSAFEQFGNPETVIIPRAGGLSKGYAFIEFDENHDLNKIMSAAISIGGRHVIIRRKLPRTPSRSARKSN